MCSCVLPVAAVTTPSPCSSSWHWSQTSLEGKHICWLLCLDSRFLQILSPVAAAVVSHWLLSTGTVQTRQSHFRSWQVVWDTEPWSIWAAPFSVLLWLHIYMIICGAVLHRDSTGCQHSQVLSPLLQQQPWLDDGCCASALCCPQHPLLCHSGVVDGWTVRLWWCESLVQTFIHIVLGFMSLYS